MGWPMLLVAAAVFSFVVPGSDAFASEADLHLPSLDVMFNVFGNSVSGISLLTWGISVIVVGMIFGLVEFSKIKALPVHSSMAEVSALIYETCKTYMIQQGKFIAGLEVLIGACIVYYFGVLQGNEASRVLLILGWSVLGILGSFGVAWFGIRINTYANSRTAFASLKGVAYPVMGIPLKAGMSIGVLLICVELLMMLVILLFVSPANAGACFIGFAIGESLGASALRICGEFLPRMLVTAADLWRTFFTLREVKAEK